MLTDTTVPPARSSGCFRIAVIVVSVLLAGAAGLYIFLATYLSAGPFDAARMNAIVEAVRRQVAGEKEVFFHIDDLSRPESLHPVEQCPETAGDIWARRIKGGLQLAIMTRNRGHIGDYGFVYSEVPVTVVDQMGSSTYYNIPGPMMALGKRIDDHWWEAANNER